MANQKPQNLQNHVRLVPLFHMFVLPVFLINLVGTIIHLVRAGISYGSVMGVLMALALFMLAFFARVFALTVQDRVIRLEMRLRLAEILAGGFAAAHSGIHAGSVGFLALCGRRGAAGAGAQSPGRKA